MWMWVLISVSYGVLAWAGINMVRGVWDAFRGGDS